MEQSITVLSEYRKYFFKSEYYRSLPFLVRFLDMLHVRQWQFTRTGNHWNYKRRLNPLNPLSYIAIILMIILVAGVSLWRALTTDSVSAIKSVFNWN